MLVTKYIVRGRQRVGHGSIMKDFIFDSLDAAVECAKASGYSALWTDDEVRMDDGFPTRGAIRVEQVHVGNLQTDTIN